MIWDNSFMFPLEIHVPVPWLPFLRDNSTYCWIWLLSVSLHSSLVSTVYAAHLLVYANCVFPLPMWSSRCVRSVVHDTLNCFAADLTNSPLFWSAKSCSKINLIRFWLLMTLFTLWYLKRLEQFGWKYRIKIVLKLKLISVCTLDHSPRYKMLAYPKIHHYNWF
jgi:hypothetical protein